MRLFNEDKKFLSSLSEGLVVVARLYDYKSWTLTADFDEEVETIEIISSQKLFNSLITKHKNEEQTLPYLRK